MPKKKYMVMARDKKTALTGITTKRGGHRDFGAKTTAMWISDKAEAEEIEHTYGMKGRGDVFVAEDQKYSYALNGEQWDMKFDEKGSHLKTIHHYTFGPMTSKAAEEFWARYEKKKAKQNKKAPQKRVRRRTVAEVIA